MHHLFTVRKYDARHIKQVTDGFAPKIFSQSPLSQNAVDDDLNSEVNQELAANLVSDVKSCGDVEWGRRLHAKVVESDSESNMYLMVPLVKMYARCGSMAEARGVFDSIRNPNVVSWNVLLLGYAENAEGRVALQLFSTMKARGYVPTSVTYLAVLKACVSLAVDEDGSRNENCLEQGRAIHTEVSCILNQNMQSILIKMYSKCGSMVHARRVFDGIENPDVVSWSTLLMGYAENGEGLVVLELLLRMKACGCTPDSVTYISALKACASLAVNGGMKKEQCLQRGREIHSEIGGHMNHYVQGTLIDMYAKCGSIDSALRVFKSIQKPDVVCWSALILGYAEHGDGITALELFSRMKATCVPNSVTYVAALQACTSLVSGDGSGKEECLERGRQIHLDVGSHMNIYVQSSLIDMYAKCGCMDEAHRIFDSFHKPSLVSWNALLLGYVENGEGLATLRLFARMKAEGCCTNTVSYIAALKACSLIGDLGLGRKFHLEINDFSAYIVTCLVDFYCKCGSILDAREVFDLHPRVRDVSTWNALLAGYVSFDYGSVFSLFEAMQDEGFRPDSVTFVCMLLCCSHAGLIEQAKEYFRAMPKQYRVTPTILHYSCMVDVLGRVNQLNEALSVIQEMPGAITWRSILGASRKWKNVDIARLAFQALVDMDKTDSSVYVLMGNMYGRSGMWEEQERVLGMRIKLGVLKPLKPNDMIDLNSVE